MSSRVSIAVFVSSTSACGVLAFSTDELTSGRAGDAGVIPQVGVDAPSAVDGAPLIVDGEVVGPDGAPPRPDGGSDSDIPRAECPANPCPSGSVCCYVAQSATSGDFVCQPACADGQPVECVGPQQCETNLGTICCGTVTFGQGSVPSCPIQALSSRCLDKCTTNVGLSCNVTNTMRLCHQQADCASDPENSNCCTYNGSGISAIVCVSDVIRDFGKLSCVQ